MAPASRPPARTSARESFQAIPYEDTVTAKAPIPITVIPPVPNSVNPQLATNHDARPKTSPNSKSTASRARSRVYDDIRRDSGLAPSTSTARDSRTTVGTSPSLRNSPSLPSISTQGDPTPVKAKKSRRWTVQRKQVAPESPKEEQQSQIPFLGITTNIPIANFEDLTDPGQVEFSKRGSMLLGGKKANNVKRMSNGHTRMLSGGRQSAETPSLRPAPTPRLPERVLSADDQILSHKVRSMYGCGIEENALGSMNGHIAISSPIAEEVPTPHVQVDETHTQGANGALDESSSQPTTLDGSRDGEIRRYNECAGGIEDWEDVEGGDVDRYGFIVARRPHSHGSSPPSNRARAPEPPRLQRVSTLLLLASETPRARRTALGRSPSGKYSERSAITPSPAGSGNQSSPRPPSSQSSQKGNVVRSNSRIRTATNKLPHNRDRRHLDEASDMLTLPPGLADIAEDEEDARLRNASKWKEWEREEKWRKMAKVVGQNKHGGGMMFEFDTKNPKLIERAWKGIPDRWRATAWHAFLSASAKRSKESATDDELISAFRQLQEQSSPDDVQIDIDVPRTINSHIMFRRRYRGGQRLLFRVLHALSIYFPDTGYVQGMAALAATFLCYFDEEMAFVMLVRMWQLRGLQRLYQSGFEGLMQALEEFEIKWLGGGEVAAKLTHLGISPTAYGTRWYLTLFNYSIPFPAQLRVWDVFLLLGDADPLTSTSASQPPNNNNNNNNDNQSSPSSSSSTSFNGTLDVLHAVSAALIDGTREILQGSDFENAMKTLTSWIPVRDEELLMRVAKAEWKMHHRRKR